MKKIFIFGHKNPDTDSVTSAIALEYLKKQLGINCVSCVLGKINNETAFVLKYFGVKTPIYLNDVKLQIKDIDYHKDFCLNNKCSIMEVHDFMLKNNTTGVALTKDDKTFAGVVTAKDLLGEMFNFDNSNLYTSYNNIKNCLDGTEVLKFNEEISGEVLVAGYKSVTFVEEVNLNNNSILVVADRNAIIEKAIQSNIKLLILTNNASLSKEMLNEASKRSINIIRTPFKSFKTAKVISSSNYIMNIKNARTASVIYENDYLDDFIQKSKKLKYNNYPVISKNNVCRGLLRLTELNNYDRKQVILVDHNEESQSVLGLDEAQIIEVIDHHKIGNISTNTPINFRNMSVGSTNTIIYYLYKENNINIPSAVAGLMLSGILSDTLAFRSPTTTEIDKSVALELSKISKVDCMSYSNEMFKASSSLEGKSMFDIVTSDLKEFVQDGIKFITAQMITTDEEELLSRKEEILSVFKNYEKDNKCDFSLFVTTNILKNGSFVLFTDKAKEVLERAFPNTIINQGFYVPGLMSRKKQLIPLIIDNL